MMFLLKFIFFIYSNYAVGYENVHKEEVYSDIGTPLIIRSNDISQRGEDNSWSQHEDDSCWCFVKFFKTIFCVGDKKCISELNMCYESHFLNLPPELILEVGDFLDPYSILNLSVTCKVTHEILSTNYWKNKCLEEKLIFWTNDVSPIKVYFANFWYKTQKIKFIKKAALIGHPQSKLILRSNQANTHNKSLNTMNYDRPKSIYIYFSYKFSDYRYPY